MKRGEVWSREARIWWAGLQMFGYLACTLAAFILLPVVSKGAYGLPYVCIASYLLGYWSRRCYESAPQFKDVYKRVIDLSKPDDVEL